MKNFKTIEKAQEWIRKNGTPDYLSIDGSEYKMTFYDMSGQEVCYSNGMNELVVYTKDRYNKDIRFSDAKLEIVW